MPAQLLALTEGPSILLDKPILLFGRHPECDVQLHSRKVSRRHCCIAQVSDYLVVRDLGSTNGIRINGIRVLEGRLHGGDELTVGNFRYQVCWDTPARGPRPPAPPPALRAARPAAPPRPPGVVDDRFLEESDEPVPLDEPLGQTAPPAKPASPSFILPENLTLAPTSDLNSNSGTHRGQSPL
jgi:predicted component of type VI protein secretion system